jgi:hypothetical protein
VQRHGPGGEGRECPGGAQYEGQGKLLTDTARTAMGRGSCPGWGRPGERPLAGRLPPVSARLSSAPSLVMEDVLASTDIKYPNQAYISMSNCILWTSLRLCATYPMLYGMLDLRLRSQPAQCALSKSPTSIVAPSAGQLLPGAEMGAHTAQAQLLLSLRAKQQSQHGIHIITSRASSLHRDKLIPPSSARAPCNPGMIGMFQA